MAADRGAREVLPSPSSYRVKAAARGLHHASISQHDDAVTVAATSSATTTGLPLRVTFRAVRRALIAESSRCPMLTTASQRNLYGIRRSAPRDSGGRLKRAVAHGYGESPTLAV